MICSVTVLPSVPSLCTQASRGVYEHNASKQHQQQRTKTTAEENAAEESNWRAFLQSAPDLFLESLPDQYVINQTQQEALQLQIDTKCQQALCPSCGAAASIGEAAVRAVSSVEVLVVTFDNICSINVPVLCCDR